MKLMDLISEHDHPLCRGEADELRHRRLREHRTDGVARVDHREGAHRGALGDCLGIGALELGPGGGPSRLTGRKGGGCSGGWGGSLGGAAEHGAPSSLTCSLLLPLTGSLLLSTVTCTCACACTCILGAATTPPPYTPLHPPRACLVGEATPPYPPVTPRPLPPAPTPRASSARL